MKTINIESLTDEQKALAEKIRDQYTKLSLDTGSLDPAVAEESIKQIYKEFEYKTDTLKFHWVDSPNAALIKINEIEKTEKKYYYTSLWGNHDAYWASLFDFCKQIKVDFDEQQTRIINAWIGLTWNCNWWYPFEQYCVCVRKPSEIHLDDQRRLHNTKGPAIAYRDGWSVYSVGGVLVPDWIITNPEKITIASLEKEQNAEVRRIMIDQMGVGKYLEDVGAETVDMDMVKVGGIGDDRAIPRALMRDKAGRKFLVGTDASTDRVYYMQVDPESKTCAEAHASIAGSIDDKSIIGNS